MKFANKSIDLIKPHIMAVLNITPDSFSDGGQLFASGNHNWDALDRRVEVAINSGASFIDVGGESTRPGASPVSEAEELQRVIPVIERINERFDTVVSVDTSSPAVMLAAAQAGVGLINDVRALSRDGALEAAVKTALPVCLMHMQGSPSTMQNSPQYDDVVGNVSSYLKQKIATYVAAGGCAAKVILDPGFGFGKSFEHNVSLFKQLPQLCKLGSPVLVGVSRKQMIGTIVNSPPEQRAVASAVAAGLAVKAGAAIVRVHDVQATYDAIRTIKVLGNN